MLETDSNYEKKYLQFNDQISKDICTTNYELVFMCLNHIKT